MGTTATKKKVTYDLNLTVNYTLEIAQEDVDNLNEMIKSGEIVDADTVEEYLGQLALSEIEAQYDATIWIPETDGEMRAWVCYSDVIEPPSRIE